MLIHCPECGSPVSDQARECPRCASPISAGGYSDRPEGSSRRTMEDEYDRPSRRTRRDDYGYDEDYPPRRPPTSSNEGLAMGLTIGGVICCVLSLIICPPLFGLIGLVCGIVLCTQGKTGRGIGVIIAAIVCGLAGMAIGAAFMMMNQQ